MERKVLKEVEVNLHAQRHGQKAKGVDNYYAPMTILGCTQVYETVQKHLKDRPIAHFFCGDILRHLQCATMAASALPNGNNGSSIIACEEFGWTGVPDLDRYDALEAVVKERTQKGENETISLWNEVASDMINFTRERFSHEMKRRVGWLFRKNELKGEIYIAGSTLGCELMTLNPEVQPPLREADIITYGLKITELDEPDEVGVNIIMPTTVKVEIAWCEYIPSGF